MENNNQRSYNDDSFKDSAKIDAQIIYFDPHDMVDIKSGNVFSNFVQSAVPSGDENNCHKLQNAYKIAMSSRSDAILNQFIIAFTDITDDKNSKFGYTYDDIVDFWDNITSPLLFLTMVNIQKSDDIENCIKTVNKIYNGSQYRIYFTFDHCDLLIFCRKNSFEEYGNLMKKLISDDDCVIANVYTFYQLYNSKVYDVKDGGNFHVLVHLNVDEPAHADDLWSSISGLPNKVERQLYFEHFNCGFYCPCADLIWLSTVTEFIKGYEHEVLVSVDAQAEINTEMIHLDQENNTPNVRIHEDIDRAFQIFYEYYNKAYYKYQRTSNMVWLRWLEASLKFAVALMDNPASRDIGTCLVPQYLDLLDYGIKFFRKLVEGKLGDADSIEMMADSMFTFFSDVAILVDSMNCGDRQLSRTPSYRLPSFEIPPKIMEYYIAVSHELMLLFREDGDKDTKYSLLITPKFVNCLGVSSIADQRVLENDQWLEIVIEESSFYTLQLTTQTLGHEISHFVGQKTRCREKRKECILEFAYSLLILLVRKNISDNLNDFIDVLGLGHSTLTFNDIEAEEVIKTAQSMFKLAQEIIPDYDTESYNRMINLESCIYLLVNYVRENPPIFDVLLNYLINSFDIKIQESLFEHTIDFSEPTTEEKETYSENNRDFFVKQSIRLSIDELLRQVLAEYMITYSSNHVVIKDENTSFSVLEDMYKAALVYFKETFADLQAIMTFDMSWNQYCKLVSRGSSVPDDCYLRMLAVAKILVDKEPSWKIITGGSKYNLGFKSIEEAINYSPTEDVEELQKLGFNSMLLHYLTKYLNECYEHIKDEFQSERCIERRKVLQKIHKTLENGTALEVQTCISSFGTEKETV